MSCKTVNIGALVAFALVLFVVETSQGMPTNMELAREKAVINELMSPLVNDYKAGKKTAVEVGNGAMGFVALADTQAAKFLLLRGAAHYYSLAKEYEKTADAIESIMKLVPDIPPGTLHEITTKVAANATAENAPRLVRLKKMSMARAFAAARLQEVEKELKASPADLKLKRMHAELVAATGDWGTALAEFAELDGETGKMAAADSAAVGESFAIADFWWDYKALATEAKDAIRERAVGLYRKAIAKGELDGLKRSLAEKRISETKGVSAGNGVPGKTVSVNASDKLAAKVDLRAGLVGHWRFDGNANDASGYRNNGIVRGVVPVEDRFGKANKAYGFSRGSFIEVPNSPTLQKITKAVTIAAWVWPREYDNNCLSVMQKGNQRECQFTLQYANGLCWYGIGNIRKSRPSKLREWQHVAVTYEYGKDARVYQDGQLIGVGKADRELAANCLPILIGCDPWGGMEYLIGSMDDVRLYNRALSEREMQELYKSEAPVPQSVQVAKTPIRKSEPAHRWSFNGNLSDSTGYRHGKALKGKVTFENGQVRIRPGGGYVDLGANVLPGGGDAEFTFEIWATKHSIQNWARVFQIPDNWGENDFYWAWNKGTERKKWMWKVPGFGHWEKDLGTEEGIEHHFVFVYGHDEERKPRFYVYLLRGENIYWWRSERLGGSMFKSHSAFWLGHGWGDRADASYNEVRIWNRAFTRDEVLLSAKLGPDKLP